MLYPLPLSLAQVTLCFSACPPGGADVPAPGGGGGGGAPHPRRHGAGVGGARADHQTAPGDGGAAPAAHRQQGARQVRDLLPAVVRAGGLRVGGRAFCGRGDRGEGAVEGRGLCGRGKTTCGRGKRKVLLLAVEVKNSLKIIIDSLLAYCLSDCGSYIGLWT